MSNKQNINYFKMNNLLEYVGIGCMAVSLPFFLFGYGFMWALSCGLLPLGAVLFVVAVSIRSSEKDIYSSIKKKTESMELSVDKLGVNERRIVKRRSPEILEDFEYEDGVMIKKSKMGGIITSKYTKTGLYLLTDALMVITRTVSLIDDEVKSKKFEISYDSIEEVRLDKEEKPIVFGKNTVDSVSERLTVKYGGGYKFSCPIHVDVKASQTVDKINRAIEEHKKSKSI